MTDPMPQDVNELSPEDRARFVMDLFHRILMHHGMWFAEAVHQKGMDLALDILDRAWRESLSNQAGRLGKTLGFQVADGLPAALVDLPGDKALALVRALSVNWLAADGIWFRSMEDACGMNDAKRTNDSCWGRFSPFEAWSVKRFLGLPERPGLPGLKRALAFRLYAFVNVWSVTDETPESFTFAMNQCRVQEARKRQGLPDYPCKSAGLVEYPSFARAVDDRIRTDCVGCPPDPHPGEWYCAWRFTLTETP